MNDTGSVMRMQQEAAERVQRMQEHSRRLVREHPVGPYADTVATEEPAPLPSAETGLQALLQGDTEQTLIVLLAVILAKNGAPLELVLALLYIAM